MAKKEKHMSTEIGQPVWLSLRRPKTRTRLDPEIRDLTLKKAMDAGKNMTFRTGHETRRGLRWKRILGAAVTVAYVGTVITYLIW